MILLIHIISVQFWTVNNFTWSMKHQLSLPGEDRVTFLFNDPEVKGRFSMFTSTGHYRRMTFRDDYDRESAGAGSLGTIVSIHKGLQM